MLYKSRIMPRELQIYQYLNLRVKLSGKERKHLFNLLKGYEGELQFDSLTATIRSDCLILNDLLLSNNRNIFQIDTLIILPDTVYLFEVKNFEGDYFYDSDRLYTQVPPSSEVNNPLIQLHRSESLLRQLLHNLGCKLTIQALIVFINPEFTLYQTPINKPFLLPGQINRFLQKVQSTSQKITNEHKTLANQLISLHIQDAPLYIPPSYQYHELIKGNICRNCGSYEITVKGTKCICKSCGEKELSEDLIMRNVKELMLLFPEMKITTNTIFEWCDKVLPKRTIGRTLKRHMNCKGEHQWRHYEF